MKLTYKKPRATFSVQSNKYNAQCAHWTTGVPLIMIKKTHEEVKKKHTAARYFYCMSHHALWCCHLPSHSTTEYLHSLWSQSTPISLCYKLCLHTVSADHLLVQHCLLKAEMTEHGGGLRRFSLRSGACSLTACLTRPVRYNCTNFQSL